MSGGTDVCDIWFVLGVPYKGVFPCFGVCWRKSVNDV